MIILFRKYQQTMMLIVTIIVIVAFVWLYNGTQFDKLDADKAYRIYNRTLSQPDVERTARRFRLATELQLNDLVYGLVGNVFTQEQAMENFVWNSYVVDHEAKVLGIVATDAEVVEGLKNLQAFHTNGQFDPIKYQQFVQDLLMPNGFTDTQLEDLVRDDLRVKKLIALIGSSVDVTPGEFRTLYTETHQKNHVSLIRFARADFSSEVTVSEEEIEAYYKTNAARLTTDEKRVASFVKLAITQAQKDAPEKERVTALQKEADRANEFTQALLKKGATFDEVAKEFGLTPEKTPAFRQSAPPEDLAAIPQAAAAIFALSTEEPFSEPVSADGAFYIFHLDEVIARRPLTLEEARPQVVESIRREKEQNAVVSKANEVRARIVSELKAGRSFQEAAEAAGVKVESLPAFSLGEPLRDQPSAQEIAEKTLDLGVGGLSDYIATVDGGLLVYLNQREPIDEAKLAEEQKVQLGQLRDFRQKSAFQEWLQVRREEANIRNLHPRRTEEEPAA